MELIRKATQVLLGAALIYTGISHLTTSRLTFQAQVPAWVPLSADFVVLASGVVEILLAYLSLHFAIEKKLASPPHFFSSQYFLATSRNTSTASMLSG